MANSQLFYPGQVLFYTSSKIKGESIAELEINSYLDAIYNSPWLILSVADWEVTTYKPHVIILCSDTENLSGSKRKGRTVCLLLQSAKQENLYEV